MALGTYKVPSRLSEAEKSATNGKLQDDFKAWVEKFIGAARDANINTIQTVGDGFISYQDAKWKKANGNDTYIENARLFCRGLAWEFTYIRGGSAESKAQDWINENAADYGLAWHVAYDKDANVKTRFFYPASIENNYNQTEVVYEGDIDLGTPSRSTSASSRMSRSGSVSSVAYFFSNQFNTIQTSAESELLKGERALANDEPVYNTIKNVVWASMRSFSSTPSGKFVAWYPDYWGKAGNTPVMTIKDIELLDLKITQSDSEFFSHVYCTGVNMDGTALRKYQSQGVVSIESNLNALAAEAELNEDGIADVSDDVSYILQKILYIPEGEEWKYTPKELYRRYGARPKNADLTNLGSAQLIEAVGEEDSVNPTYIMPFLYALYSFMQHWAQQNKVDVTITFNPSIIPGCRIKLESLDVSFYVKGVTHSMDYSSGFTTNIEAICPTGTLVSGMVNV